jgi:hypothetical protein
MQVLKFQLTEEQMEEQLRAVLGEEYVQGFREWRSALEGRITEYPFYNQVMLIRGVKPGYFDQCLAKPIEVSAEQMKHLRSLDGISLERDPSLHIDYGFADKIFKKSKVAVNQDSKEGRIVKKGLPALDDFFNLMDKFSDEGLDILSGLRMGISPKEVEVLHNNFTEVLEDFDFRRNPTMVRAREYLSLAIRKAREKGDRKEIEIVEQSANMQTERALNEFLGLRLNRTRALMNVHPNFARPYFSYGVIVQEIIEKLCNQEPVFENTTIGLGELGKFVKKDNELYNGMVGSFIARPETVYVQPKSSAVVKPIKKEEKKTEKVTVIPINRPVYEPTPQENLRNAIFDNNSVEFTRDSRLRVEYFVEDASGLYNGELDEVAKSFSKLKFGRRLRCKFRPDEMQIRNFFDDVYLQHTRSGKVPSSSDLKRLYEEDCTVGKQ